MKFRLFILFALHPLCLSYTWDVGFSGRGGGGDGSSEEEENIDNKYWHPYIMDGRNFMYYLQMGVRNGQITQEEMDREIIRAYASNTIDSRADISDKFYKVNYYFRTRKLSSNVRLRRANKNQQGWYKGQPVKLIIHGWTGDDEKLTYWDKLESQTIWDIQKAFYENYNYNVIVVDWTYFSSTSTLQYLKAAGNAVRVGEEVADFVQDLKKKGLISSLDKVHIIGHSLGAQVAGRVGYHTQINGHGKIGRITGSDPAGPAFAYVFEEIIPNPISVPGLSVGNLMYAHVSKDNANFVDILHCNQGKMWEGDYGSDRKAGHADFLVNSGSNQPPCSYKEDYTACSHKMCQVHFLKSIKTKRKACRKDPKGNCPWYNPKCWKRSSGRGNVLDMRGVVLAPPHFRTISLEGRVETDCVVFGEWCPRSARGTYYIDIKY